MASGSTYDYVVSFSEKGMNKMFEDLFSKDLQLSKLAFSGNWRIPFVPKNLRSPPCR